MQTGRILAFCQGAMFLRSNKRIKDGKEHRYYTVVESRRLRSGPVAPRQVWVSGGKQRQSASGMAQDAGGVR